MSENLTASASQSTHRYPVIDLLKGYSILTIVAMHLIQLFWSHAPKLLDRAASFGGSGVHVFLFASGFGLMLSYSRKPTRYFEFLRKRFLKIYIPYIIIVLISAAVPFMYTGPDRIEALLSHIFLFKMFVSRYENSFGAQLWFISTIFQFYLVFIPLAKVKEKLRPIVFFLISLMISISWWIIVAKTGLVYERTMNSFFLQYLWEFVLGMCVADYVSSHGGFLSVSTPKLLVCAVIGILIQGFTGIKGGYLRLFNDIPALLGYGSLALIICRLSIKPLRRLLLFISSISYEWYLVHVLVFTAVFCVKPADAVTELFMCILAFALSILAAWIYKKVLGRLSGLKPFQLS